MCENILVIAPVALMIGSIIGSIGVFLQLSTFTVLIIAVATGIYVELLAQRGYFSRVLGSSDTEMQTEYEE